MNTCEDDCIGELGIAVAGIYEIDCVTDAVVVAEEFWCDNGGIDD